MPPSNGIPANLETKLWQTADKLRGHMDAAEYKHVVLGLIFLKYISDAFQERYQQLTTEPYADPEERDEYSAENIFFVPEEAHCLTFRKTPSSPPSAYSLTIPCVPLSVIIPRSKGYSH